MKTPLAMRASLVDVADVVIIWKFSVPETRAGWDAAVAVIAPAVVMAPAVTTAPAAAMSLLRCFEHGDFLSHGC